MVVWCNIEIFSSHPVKSAVDGRVGASGLPDLFSSCMKKIGQNPKEIDGLRIYPTDALREVHLDREKRIPLTRWAGRAQGGDRHQRSRLARAVS